MSVGEPSLGRRQNRVRDQQLDLERHVATVVTEIHSVGLQRSSEGMAFAVQTPGLKVRKVVFESAAQGERLDHDLQGVPGLPGHISIQRVRARRWELPEHADLVVREPVLRRIDQGDLQESYVPRFAGRPRNDHCSKHIVKERLSGVLLSGISVVAPVMKLVALNSVGQRHGPALADAEIWPGAATNTHGPNMARRWPQQIELPAEWVVLHSAVEGNENGSGIFQM